MGRGAEGGLVTGITVCVLLIFATVVVIATLAVQQGKRGWRRERGTGSKGDSPAAAAINSG